MGNPKWPLTAASEVRVDNVGPFLLEHFHGMAETSEREQTRLAWAGARTV
ncbi:hypothetical protein [Streptomyces misionensis]